MIVLMELEGVLAQCEPEDDLPGKQPYLDAKKLFLSLIDKSEIMVSTQASEEHAQFWLRSNGFRPLHTVLAGRTLGQSLREARSVLAPELVICSPQNADQSLAEGYATLAFGRPLFGRKDFRPDSAERRTWDQMLTELEHQQQLTPEPVGGDGRFE